MKPDVASTHHREAAARAVIVACLMSVIGLQGLPLSAQPPLPGAGVAVDMRLPSASTGGPSGTLALRLFVPESAKHARYPDGAPVIIVAPGGTGVGSLRPVLPRAGDLVRITFLFPGGVDPVDGRASDGSYDHRGPVCVAALRDVILYAAGKLADDQGRTIDEVLPVGVRHHNIGILGLSNGGNVATAVAATHGAELVGDLRYIVQWESPVSSQIATFDLGAAWLDCPGGETKRLPTVNPRYLEYGLYELAADFADLAYDAGNGQPRVYHEGTGDAAYTSRLDPDSGCRTPDLDGDGVLTDDEDWPLVPFTDGVVSLYSRPVTKALHERTVFGPGWPRGIATVAAADEWWDARESVRHYAAALANIPDLDGMVLASAVDHAQALPAHDHIRQAFEGWRQAGAWVRLNPPATYLAQVDPELSIRRDLPFNAPNVAPADWLDAASYTIPEDIPDGVTHAAAVWHMADRAEVREPAATPTYVATPSATHTGAPTSTATPSATTTTAPPLVCYLPLLLLSDTWR